MTITADRPRSRQSQQYDPYYAPVFSHRGRVNRQNPCPICRKTDWCSMSDNGYWLLCQRPDKAPIPAGWTFVKIGKAGGALYRNEMLPDLLTNPYANATAGDLKPPPPTPTDQPGPEAGRAAPNRLHAVYTDLLTGLGMSAYHLTQLTDPTGPRRLSPAEIAAMGVKSLPESWDDINALVDRLTRKYGKDILLTVPGFYQAKNQKRLNLAARRGGLLIPRHEAGLITGLIVRPNNSKSGAKYFWLSSRKHGGPGPANTASCYQPLTGITQPATVGITEGTFKAFISAQRLGLPMLSVPGVANWLAAGTIDMALKLAGAAGTAIVFYDMELNEQTDRARYALADALVAAGLTVKIARWTGYKGIDDLLLAGGEYQLENYVPGLAGLPIDRIINSRFMPDLQISKKITLVKSSKGTGKTEWVSRLLGAIGPKSSVLSIGPRVALLEEQARRWKLEFYQDFKGDTIDRKGLTSSKRLAICIDSLVHFQSADQKTYIILDEIEMLLRHVTGKTLKDKRQPALAMFNALIALADHVIALDADINSISYKFFSRLVGAENIELVVNTYQRPNAPAMLAYDSKPELITVLLDKLKAGVKCYVACNIKREALALERQIRNELPEIKTLCITQDNSADPEIRMRLKNLNLYAPDYDLLIASPTLATGIDISVDHFTETFLIGSHESTNHAELLQHMARNRKAEVIHSYITPGERNQPADPEYWKAYSINQSQKTGLAIAYSTETGQRIAAPFERDYLELWADIKAADIASRNRLAGNFYDQARREGHAVIPARDKQTAPDKEALEETNRGGRAAKLELEVERIDAILAAPEIDAKEAAKLEAKSYLPKPERAKLERHTLKTFYNQPVTEKLITQDAKGKMKTRLNNFMIFTGQIDSKEKDRKIFDDTGKLLPDAGHHTSKKELRAEVIAAAGFQGRGLDAEFTADQLKEAGFISWVETNKDRLQLLNITVKSDFAEKPVELVSTVFKQLGLKFNCRKVGARGQQKLYYKLDKESWQTMKSFAAARLKALEAKRHQEAA